VSPPPGTLGKPGGLGALPPHRTKANRVRIETRVSNATIGPFQTRVFRFCSCLINAGDGGRADVAYHHVRGYRIDRDGLAPPRGFNSPRNHRIRWQEKLAAGGPGLSGFLAPSRALSPPAASTDGFALSGQERFSKWHEITRISIS